jgi:hypothetical protein
VFDLVVQRPASVLAKYAGDVVIEFGVLAMQCHDRDTDDREDETQLSYMLSQLEAQRIICRRGMQGW